jgi:hypothetical protein
MADEQSEQTVFRGDHSRVARRIEASDPTMTTIQLPTPSRELAVVYSWRRHGDLGALRLVVEAKVDGCVINYGAGVTLPKGHSLTLYVAKRAPNEYAWYDATTEQEIGSLGRHEEPPVTERASEKLP